MEPLIIQPTSQTPKIILNKKENLLEISGHSLPDNASIFYSRVLEWFENYTKSPNKKTVMSFKMDYYNTTSSKYIFEILKTLDKLHNKGKETEIHWYYPEDDADMEEAGEDYSSIVEVPFKLISIES